MSDRQGPWLDCVESTWTGTLNLPLEETSWPPTLHPEVSAFVQIMGDWQGLVVVAVSQALARRSTGSMFDLPPDAVEPEMVRDAMGEMANILGGAIKAGIVGTRGLSLPTVVQGEDHSVYVPDMSLACERAWRCGEDLVSVKLYEHNANACRLGDTGDSLEAAA